MPLNPPVYGYSTTNAFGDLTFTNPVAIVSPPGETNRLFIVEQGGRVAVITNLANPNRTVFLNDLQIRGGVPSDEQGLLGMAFHPGYATNGFFYLFYVANATDPQEGLNILSRFQVSSTNANVALTNTEVRLLVQNDEKVNHNGGDLHFGPDGYLYVSLGDEGGANDDRNNSQRIDGDFFSGIIRIDVDKQPGSLMPNVHPARTTNYTVPPDNPFIGATNFNGSSVNPANVRTEFWAVGLRNPWRFCFDPATGFLYCGDVGQGAWEEIDIITKGGNYGWAYREGTVNGPKSNQAPGGFTSINPIQDYTHGNGTNQGLAVIGGVVFRGNRIAQLTGAYVFADNLSGNVWMLRYDGTNTTPFQQMFAEAGISAFGTDPHNGDVLMANQNLDTIRRLIYSTNQIGGGTLPATLAGTGAFTNLASLTPHAGIVPYAINVPFWSDRAIKSRWFSVPNTNLDIGFNGQGNWSFPTGTVWIKHFELELTNGVPASRKRLETRLLVKNDTGVHGVTYRWGDSLTNAALIAQEGLDEAFVINEGGGILRTQIWHYPSRQECLTCHTPVGGHALGFNTPQMNHDFNYGGVLTNQILALSQAGYFVTNVTDVSSLPALAWETNTNASLEYRSRSYLAANCVQCHQPGGAGLGSWDARITTPLTNAGIINGALVDNLGDANNRVFVPGSLSNSVIYARVANFGPKHMPPLATSVLNAGAISLLSQWIAPTNTPPVFPAQTNRELAELTTLTVTNRATDADDDNLNYTLLQAPTNAVIDTNGVIVWMPSEVQGPGTYLLETVVTDDGQPPLSATNLFSVAVSEVNVAPGLLDRTNLTLTELSRLLVTNSATDADLPANLLTYQLLEGPTNAVIDANGMIDWTPAEAQGPGTNAFTTVVADNGEPVLRATNSFTVIVLESNQPPVLASVADRTVHADSLVVLTNLATDPDIPPNSLAFSLGPNAPTGAGINAASGVLTWTPSDANANTTNNIIVRVTDNGVPNLEDTRTFVITVTSRLAIEAVAVSNGVVTVTWSAITGKSYGLQSKESIEATNWETVSGDVIASGPSASKSVSIGTTTQKTFYRVVVIP